MVDCFFIELEIPEVNQVVPNENVHLLTVWFVFGVEFSKFIGEVPIEQ